MQATGKRNVSINALWVVLIDHSSSMGEPFSASTEFKGFSETGDFQNKLIAAKENLFRQIDSLKTARDVAVIAFTGTSKLLFKCAREQVSQQKELINALQPFDSTDIAGALDFAYNCVQKWEHYDLVRFLVISDGLSEVAQAQEVAFKCFSDKIYIDVVLIDPSQEGQAMAEAISLGGKVTAVYSSAEFDQAVSQEREAYEQDLVKANEAYAELEKKEVIEKASAFGGVLTIIIGVITVLSLAVGIAVGLSGGNILFKISILISVILVLFGIFLLYLANESTGQAPLIVDKNNNVRMVSVLRRTGKKRTRLLFGGWGNIALGILVLALALFVVPDSPIIVAPTQTPTATNTVTMTPAPTLIPTHTVTATSTAFISKTPTIGSTGTPIQAMPTP